MKTGKTNMKLILASRSPRRKHLIQGLDIEVKMVVPPEVDESFPKTMSPDEVPVFLARKKSDHFPGPVEDHDILVTADTIVVLDGVIVNKPSSLDDAMDMLMQLSGKMHTVITGVCLRSVKKTATFSSFTKVYFSSLTKEEICYYLDAYKPLDKAGAYGIQEWIGYVGVERIEGSFFNVMGLPLHRLYSEIKKF